MTSLIFLVLEFSFNLLSGFKFIFANIIFTHNNELIKFFHKVFLVQVETLFELGPFFLSSQFSILTMGCSFGFSFETGSFDRSLNTVGRVFYDDRKGLHWIDVQLDFNLNWSLTLKSWYNMLKADLISSKYPISQTIIFQKDPRVQDRLRLETHHRLSMESFRGHISSPPLFINSSWKRIFQSRIQRCSRLLWLFRILGLLAFRIEKHSLEYSHSRVSYLFVKELAICGFAYIGGFSFEDFRRSRSKLLLEEGRSIFLGLILALIAESIWWFKLFIGFLYFDKNYKIYSKERL